jgi:hypothetical protein
VAGENSFVIKLFRIYEYCIRHRRLLQGESLHVLNFSETLGYCGSMRVCQRAAHEINSAPIRLPILIQRGVGKAWRGGSEINSAIIKFANPCSYQLKFVVCSFFEEMGRELPQFKPKSDLAMVVVTHAF